MDAGGTELGGKRAANGAAQERPRRRECCNTASCISPLKSWASSGTALAVASRRVACRVPPSRR